MSPKQKALFVQLQIAFAGVLIGTFGLLWKEWLLLLFGSLVFLYGMIRFILIKKIMDSNPDVSDAETAKALDLYAADRKKKDRKFYDPDYDPFYDDDFDDEEEDFFFLPFMKAQAARHNAAIIEEPGEKTDKETEKETEEKEKEAKKQAALPAEESKQDTDRPDAIPDSACPASPPSQGDS